MVLQRKNVCCDLICSITELRIWLSEKQNIDQMRKFCECGLVLEPDL